MSQRIYCFIMGINVRSYFMNFLPFWMYIPPDFVNASPKLSIVFCLFKKRSYCEVFIC